MSCPEEYIRLAIHKSELKFFSKEIKQFINENRSIEFYPSGRRKGKKVDKAKEIKRLIKEMMGERAKNKDKESNYECFLAEQMVELIQKMMMWEIRKLELEKLLD